MFYNDYHVIAMCCGDRSCAIKESGTGRVDYVWAQGVVQIMWLWKCPAWNWVGYFCRKCFFYLEGALFGSVSSFQSGGCAFACWGALTIMSGSGWCHGSAQDG